MKRSSEIGVKRLHSAMSNLFDEVDHIKWIRCRFQAGDSCGSSGRQFIYINYWEDKLYTSESSRPQPDLRILKPF